jgi:hypothetical protein
LCLSTDKENNALEKNTSINFINVLLGLVELGFVKFHIFGDV